MGSNDIETRFGRLIVFDGVCVLCAAWLRFVIKHDTCREFRFSTIQSPAGRCLLANHGLDPNDPVSFLLLIDGQTYDATNAVIRVVSEFGGFWRTIKILYVVPRPIRDWLYGVIARHRYRLFGRHETCIVPGPEIQDRFIHDVNELESEFGYRAGD